MSVRIPRGPSGGASQPRQLLIRVARNDDESVSLGTSLAMTSEREPHNYGAVSPIYLGVITLCTPTLANYTKGSMRPPFKGVAIWYNN